MKRLMALVEMTPCFLSLGESCSFDLIESENSVEAVEDMICFGYSRNGWFCSGKAVERVRWAMRVPFQVDGNEVWGVLSSAVKCAKWLHLERV